MEAMNDGTGTQEHATTITEFLEARIAEDEAVARAAKSGRWKTEAVEHGRFAGIESRIYSLTGSHILLSHTDGEAGQATNENAAHIARHDPARVLAECAAKRAIIEEHYWRSEEGHRGCGLCNYNRDYGWEETGPCKTIRALAAVYADHPEYQEA